MRLIWMIGLRNLVRQKRRNILLGSALAFGIMILIVANSFSKGITENLLNRVIVYLSGHVSVMVVEQSRIMTPVIRDAEEIRSKIKANVKDIKEIQDNVGGMCRAIGNGKADYVYVVGLDLTEDFKTYFEVLEGSYKNFANKTFINPVALSRQKADYLNLKIGDQVRIRLQNVNGQNQTGILTVAVIIKSQNMFMDYAVFTPLNDLKNIMGYRPYEAGSLNIILKEPKTAIDKAVALHKALKPTTAFIVGKLDNKEEAVFLALPKEVSLNVIEEYMQMGTKEWDIKNKGAVISLELAKKLRKNVGDEIRLTYQPKFVKELYKVNIKITGIAIFSKSELAENVVFLNNGSFFEIYNFMLPREQIPLSNFVKFKAEDKFWNFVSTKWILLERSTSTKDYTKKLKQVMQNPRTQPIVEVGSMFEMASQIIQMEKVFNMVTFVATIILFFIIMIGVLNSLRMTVKERTREIGTMRAIGMRASDVRWSFMMESVLLTIISWMVGVILAFIVMWFLGLIQFSYNNAFNMLMVDRKIYFVPTFGNIFKNLVIVLIFTIVTAYFPAKKAAGLKPAEAFSHLN